MKKLGWGIGAVFAMTSALIGCGDDRTVVVSRIAEDGSTRVVALDNSFRAETMSVPAGTEVLFTNVGRNVHDVVPSGGSSDWGVEQGQFSPGASYRVTFTEPGLYPYYCSIHGNETAGMVGMIEVTS